MLIFKTNPLAPYPDTLVNRVNNLCDYKVSTTTFETDHSQLLENIFAFSTANPNLYDIHVPKVMVQHWTISVQTPKITMPDLGIISIQSYAFLKLNQMLDSGQSLCPGRCSLQPMRMVGKNKTLLLYGNDIPLKNQLDSSMLFLARSIDNLNEARQFDTLANYCTSNKASLLLVRNDPEYGVLYKLLGPWWLMGDILVSDVSLVPAGVDEVSVISLYRAEKTWIPLCPFSLLPPKFNRCYAKFSILSPS